MYQNTANGGLPSPHLLPRLQFKFIILSPTVLVDWPKQRAAHLPHRTFAPTPCGEKLQVRAQIED